MLPNLIRSKVSINEIFCDKFGDTPFCHRILSFMLPKILVTKGLFSTSGDERLLKLIISCTLINLDRKFILIGYLDAGLSALQIASFDLGLRVW